METLQDVALDVHRLYEQFDTYGFREQMLDDETIETALERVAKDSSISAVSLCIEKLEYLASDWEEKGHVLELKERFAKVVCGLPHKVKRYGLYDTNPSAINIDGVAFEKIASYERPALDWCFGTYLTDVYAVKRESDGEDGREDVFEWLRVLPAEQFENALVECGLDVHKHVPTYAETAGQKIFGSEEVQFMNDCIYITWKEYYDV